MKTTTALAAALVLSVSLPASAAEPTMIRSFDELVTLLDRDSVTHQTKPESQIVLIPVAKAPIDDTMLIRWAGDDGVVHFVLSMGLEVPESRTASVQDAILRLNHASPVPGLGINPDARVLYYRMSVTTAPEGGISDGKIRTCFRHTLKQAAAFHSVMQGVLDGRVSSDTAVDYFNATMNTRKPVPSGRYEVELADHVWALTFDDDGTVRLYRDGKELVESSSMTNGSQITFIDRTGGFKVSDPGVYEWKYEDGMLQFRLVKDSSDGRTMVLTTTAWKHVTAG